MYEIRIQFKNVQLPLLLKYITLMFFWYNINQVTTRKLYINVYIYFNDNNHYIFIIS